MWLIGPLVDAAFSILLEFGHPMLFVLFVLKGAIVGKPLPTSVFLPGYLVAISATGRQLWLSIAVASVGYVCGQLLIYGLARRQGLEAVQSIRWIDLSDAQLRRADRFFSRYSGAGVVITNLVPYAGSFIMVPAGLASYPAVRLTVYALASTVLNYVLIVWIVLGSLEYLSPLA